jgi:hypothetical protein
MRQLQEKVMPGLDLKATSQGAFGGSRQAMQKGQASANAVGQMSDAIARANLQARQQSIGQRSGDISANLGHRQTSIGQRGGDINALLSGRGQDIQQNAEANRAREIGMRYIPQAQQALMTGSNIQREIGAERTKYHQALIDANIRKFNFNQQARDAAIDRLGNRMMMTPKGYTTTNEAVGGSWGNILGGVGFGAKYGGQIAKDIFGTNSGGSTGGSGNRYSTN